MDGRVTIPAEAGDALDVLRSQFGSDLVAVYLYGSAAAGGLRPNSDVDLLVVVASAMSPEARRQLADGLMRVSGLYPVRDDGRHPLEVTVFRRDDLAAFAHPVGCEFIYGEWLRADFSAGRHDRPVDNPDNTLLLAQARQQAVTLLGPNADRILPSIGAADIRRAIGDARPELLASLNGDERNVLLTLARMWCTLTTGNFVPKDAAARWAIPRISSAAAADLAYAAEIYVSGGPEDWQSRHRSAAQTASLLSDRIVDALGSDA